MSLPDATQLHWTGWLSKGMKFSTSLCTLEVFDGAIGIHGKGILTQRMPIYRDYNMKMKTEINKRLGLKCFSASFTGRVSLQAGSLVIGSLLSLTSSNAHVLCLVIGSFGITSSILNQRSG